MTRRYSVRYDNAVIQYEVRRSERRKKTVEIRVNNGVVELVAPKRTKLADLQAIVLNKAPWIIKRMAQPAPQAPSLGLETGDSLPYLGQSVPLVVEPAEGRSAGVLLDAGRFLVAAPFALDESLRYEAVRRAFEAWYRARAGERIAADVERWWPRLGRGQRSRIIIRRQKRQWGSCAQDGTLRFNWKLVMTEPDLIEYVVVHELAHLTHPNHSADFWGLVTAVMPDARQRRKRLDATAGALPPL